ncbi:MAG: gamma-glutamyltransferase, partial [Burkholderiales bacterium]
MNATRPAHVVRRLLFVCFVCLTLAGAKSAAQESAIASAHPLATQVGRAMLERGGNAFDAAVAIAAALAVVEPYSSGLGGGGFFLLHRTEDALTVMVDARETAPAGVRNEDYFDGTGAPIRGGSVRGGTAAASPGVPAALVHIARRYGRLPLTVVLAPATRLAREGFTV